MDPEDLGPARHSRGEETDRPGIPGDRILDLQHLSNNGLARDRKEHRAFELLQPVQLPQETQVVFPLLGKVDPGINHQLVRREPLRLRNSQLVLEETLQLLHDVIPGLIDPLHLGGTRGVHQQQGGPMFRNQAGIAPIRQSAHVINQFRPQSERRHHHLAAPGVHREHRGPDLLVIPRSRRGSHLAPPLENSPQACAFFLYRDGRPVGAGTLRSQVHDIRPRRHLGPRLPEGLVHIQRSVT